ncbi:MAG: hypothetical protein ACREHV_09230, partial [Rhizomicrobium sp.]
MDYQNRFFASLKNKFKATYAGQYVAVIVAELARIDPASFAKIVTGSGLMLEPEDRKSLLAGELTIALEWPFPGKQRGKNRRADIALYRSREEPILLIEIKDEDGRQKANVAQIRDYLAFIRKRNVLRGTSKRTAFLLLSRYAVRVEDAQLLAHAKMGGLPIGTSRHSESHKLLQGADGEMARMFREFLEDSGMTYREIDLKKEMSALVFMSKQMLGIEKKLGRTRSSASVEAVPDLMRRFFGNLDVLGNWAFEKNNNRELFTQRFRRNFSVAPEYQLSTRAVSALSRAKNDK